MCDAKQSSDTYRLYCYVVVSFVVYVVVLVLECVGLEVLVLVV